MVDVAGEVEEVEEVARPRGAPGGSPTCTNVVNRAKRASDTFVRFASAATPCLRNASTISELLAPERARPKQWPWSSTDSARWQPGKLRLRVWRNGS